MNRSRSIAFSFLACLITAAVLVWPGAAAAQDGGSFDALATAQGVRKHVVARGYLTVEQVDLAGPAAFAQIDSNGTSQAYGAYPFPGNDVLVVPGIVKGVLTDQFGQPDLANQIPAYPLIAQTSHPVTPKDDVSTGPIALNARSDENSSSGLAVGGAAGGAEVQDLSVGLTRAVADVARASDGTVRSKGESITEVLSFGAGTLRIGRVRSFAEAVVDPDGKEDVKSGLEVGQVSVAGQAVGFTEKGLVVAGTEIPIDSSPLGAALESAGISLKFIAPVKDEDGKGITAPGLEVTVTAGTEDAPPNPLVPTTSPPTVTYAIGRASARAEASAVEIETPVGGGVVAPPDVAPPAVSPPIGPPVGEVPPTTGPGDVGQPSGPIARVATDGNSVMGIYILLAMGGLAIVGGAQLIRILGVKLSWAS